MATKTKEKRHTIREKCEVQHQFDAGEYKSKSETLAQLLADVSLKQEAVKAASATAKAEIKALQSDVSELANQLRLGAEQRTVEADVEMDRKAGMKTYRFADGPDKGKVIKKVAMTEDDFERLPLPDPEPKKQDEAFNKFTAGQQQELRKAGEPLVKVFADEAAAQAAKEAVVKQTAEAE